MSKLLLPPRIAGSVAKQASEAERRGRDERPMYEATSWEGVAGGGLRVKYHPEVGLGWDAAIADALKRGGEDGTAGETGPPAGLCRYVAER